MVRLASIFFLIVLYGQLIINAFGYYFNLSHPSWLAWAILYVLTALIAIKNLNNIRLLDYDLYFILFISYVCFSYIALGESDSQEFATWMFIICLGPYVSGRILGNHIGSMLVNNLNIILILYILIILMELVKNPALLFEHDRLFLFGTEADPGFGTAYFIGLTFGSAWIIVVARVILASNNVKKLKIDKFSLVNIFILPLFISGFGSRSSLFAMVVCVALLVSVMFFISIRHGVNLLSKRIGLVSIVLIFCFFAYELLPESRKLLLSQIFTFGWYTSNDECALAGTSIIARVTLIKESLRVFSDFPVFGVGASNFGLYYCGDKGEFLSPHSTIAQVLAEFGIVGFSLYALLIITMISKVVGRIRTYQYNLTSSIWVLFSLWLFMFLQMQITGNIYYDFQFYLLTGLLASSLRNSEWVSVGIDSAQKINGKL